MKELFNQHSLGLGIKEYKFESKNLHTQIFTRWNNLLQNSFKKEEQLQTDFLNDIFGEVLGYNYKRGEAESNLEKEEKTELDGQKPDGILGFFSGKAKDVRVIIELKDQKTNLDTSQNRATDKRSPIEQAFGYVAKYQGIEWVIASNFKEIRLYKANYAGKYHSFAIEELASDDNKIKEFHFLLAKNRLFTKTPNQSPVHSLDTSKKGNEIEKKFYQHYSKLREEIWHNLIELNTKKHYGRNFYLYKAQKLIDRIVFIRFCKENGALENDAVLEALNNKYIKGKYSRMKALFTAMNEGNPEIGIAKFNGGLFAEDKDLDSLEISDEIIDKIVILYSYNFGSDLDVNILGHIFEQSISDLENLTGDNEKKRKKDGVFYTPAYITEYIVKEAIGGWLADRKAEIGFTCPGVGEVEAKSRALCKKEKGEKEKWQAYAESLKSIKILDPACGSGAFLVKVFDYLQNEWQEVEKNLQIWHIKTDWNYQKILTHNIYGVDINPTSVGITKLSLWLKTAHYREPLTTLDDNIKIGNSLIDDEFIAGYYSEFEGKIVSEIIERQGELLNEGQDEFKKDKQDIDYYFKKSLAFKWNKEFKAVFEAGGFDVVVGNPPYGADIDKDAKYFAKKYPNSTKNHKDSYKIFIDKALQISKAKVGFIVPNTFLYQPRYQDVKQIIDNFYSEVLNLGEDIFENVELPTAILVVDKNKQGSKIADLRTIERSKIENTIATRNFELKENYQTKYFFQDDIKRLEEILELKDAGVQYATPGGGKNAKGLSKIADRLFSKVQNEDFSIPFFTGSNISKNGWLFDHTPQIFFNANYKKVLVGNEWCHFSQNVFECNEKILWRQTADRVIATPVKSSFYFGKTIHAGILKPNYIELIDYLYLTCILNSKYYKYLYMQKVLEAGKVFPQVKLSYLKDLPFRLISKEAQTPFITQAQIMLDLNKQFNELSNKFTKLLSADLAVVKITKKLEKWHNLEASEFFAEVGKQNKTLSLTQKSSWLEHFEAEKPKALAIQSKITQTDSEIDKMVYVLYGLSEEEIAVVEGFII